MNISELRLGPTSSSQDLSIAADELAQKVNEVIRNLVTLAASSVTEQDLQQLQAGEVVTEQEHRHPWNSIDDIPDTASRWPVWSEVERKPLEFPSEAHRHPWGDLDEVPSTFAPEMHALDDATHTGNLPVARVDGAVAQGGVASFSQMEVYGSADFADTTSFASSLDLTFIDPTSPPFFVAAGAAQVGNLDVGKLGGFTASDFARPSEPAGYAWAGAQLFNAVCAFNDAVRPFTVSSTGRVDNLNAEMLDGYRVADFLTTFGQLLTDNTWTGTNLFTGTNRFDGYVRFANVSDFYTSTDNAAIYGSSGTGTSPFNVAGHLFLQARASSGRRVYLCTGSPTQPGLILDFNGNLSLGRGAITNPASNHGYPYMPTLTGPPTGAPATYAGMAPFAIEATATPKLWVYVSGAWKSAALV